MNDIRRPINHEENSSSISLQESIIYGPVFSRRLGRSFGINLLSTTCKICSFDCIYCEYGPTGCHTLNPPEGLLPGVEEILFAVEKSLRKPHSMDCLTFSGNGEPTLHPKFPEIVKGVKQLRDDIRPSVKLAVLSNGTQLNNPEVFTALSNVDLPMMKLDGGDAETVGKINRPVSSVKFEDIFEGLKALPGMIIQSMLPNGVVSNTQGEEYVSLAEALKVLNPACVHIYSIERPPAINGVKPVPPKNLFEIKKDLSDRFGLRVKAFWR